MLVEQQGQILCAVGGDVEQQRRTVAGPEAERDVLCSQRGVRVDGGAHDAAAAAAAVSSHFLKHVAEGRS